jgi:hypothetical protein
MMTTAEADRAQRDANVLYLRGGMTHEEYATATEAIGAERPPANPVSTEDLIRAYRIAEGCRVAVYDVCRDSDAALAAFSTCLRIALDAIIAGGDPEAAAQAGLDNS